MNKELRAEIIKRTQEIGNKLAINYRFTKVSTQEDRQKGIWGEATTEYLEEKYGECTTEIRWEHPNFPNFYVEFDFRFADPRLAVHFGNIMASVEISDFNNETKENDDNWKISEYQVWEEGGLEHAHLLTNKLNEMLDGVKEKYGIKKE